MYLFTFENVLPDVIAFIFYLFIFFFFKASPLLSMTLGPKIKGHLALDSTFFCLFTRLTFKISALPLGNKTKQKQRNTLKFSLLHTHHILMFQLYNLKSNVS